jgi:hypothetical protein
MKSARRDSATKKITVSVPTISGEICKSQIIERLSRTWSFTKRKQRSAAHTLNRGCHQTPVTRSIPIIGSKGTATRCATVVGC